MDINKLKNEFSSLLDDCEKEQKYQEFLEKYPCFIPREFIQNHGVHFDLVFRKLSMAKDYISDFFYLSKSSDDWNCVIIEIEKPQSKFFKNGTNDFHKNFADGLSQIRKWRAWFEESENKDYFINNTLRSIRIPTVMARNPCHIKYVLVHGRREEYSGNQIRTGAIRAEERDDFKIITFDSLMESLHTKNDLYVAVKKNEYVDIISKKFVEESIFSWMEPSSLRITNELKEDILKNKSTWHHHHIENEEMVLSLESTLPKIQCFG